MKRDVFLASLLTAAGILLASCAENATVPPASTPAPAKVSPTPAPAVPATPMTTTAGASALSVQTTPIADIANNAQARAILEDALPKLAGHYDRIGSMTLAQLAPHSNGYIDDAKLKQLQDAFDKIK
jgi:hypothetical protein